MTYSENISEIAEKLANKEPQSRKQKILLYSHGISAKLQNAEYSLANLLKLKDYPDTYDISTDDLEIPISDRIHFYVDTFFAFLYSSLDVTAQVINQKLKLGIDENRVSIKRIHQELTSQNPTHPLLSIIDVLLKSKYFKNLDRYRNCSTHRRQIYLQTTTLQISETPGYSTTGKLTQVLRILCDNPLELSPKVNQSRELISYTTDLLDKVKKEILTILKSL